MRANIIVFLLSVATAWPASPLPPAKPILTASELQAAAEEAPVRTIDFVVSTNNEEIENKLAQQFFNQPEEHRYSGVTNEDWAEKWELFSHALVKNAKKAGLSIQSLGSCLQALNRGRNRQTMLWPVPDQKLFPVGTPDDEIAAFEKQAEEKYQLILTAREKNPEPYFNDHLAIIPVAAYLARHSRGECWIIVCKWETTASDKDYSPLGHIMVWAMDTKTFAVVGYVTCD